jgi:hypothetical protein
VGATGIEEEEEEEEEDICSYNRIGEECWCENTLGNTCMNFKDR